MNKRNNSLTLRSRFYTRSFRLWHNKTIPHLPNSRCSTNISGSLHASTDPRRAKEIDPKFFLRIPHNFLFHPEGNDLKRRIQTRCYWHEEKFWPAPYFTLAFLHSSRTLHEDTILICVFESSLARCRSNEHVLIQPRIKYLNSLLFGFVLSILLGDGNFGWAVP